MKEISKLRLQFTEQNFVELVIAIVSHSQVLYDTSLFECHAMSMAASQVIDEFCGRDACTVLPLETKFIGEVGYSIHALGRELYYVALRGCIPTHTIYINAACREISEEELEQIKTFKDKIWCDVENFYQTTLKVVNC